MLTKEGGSDHAFSSCKEWLLLVQKVSAKARKCDNPLGEGLQTPWLSVEADMKRVSAAWLSDVCCGTPIAWEDD